MMNILKKYSDDEYFDALIFFLDCIPHGKTCFCFDGHAARYNCYRTGGVDRVLLQIWCTIE